MIEKLDGFPDEVAAFLCSGHVSRTDYEKVLIPEVEKKLKAHKKLRLYYEIGPDFTGIDPFAVWEDFKTGIEHLLHWERVAVVTDVDWIRNTMTAFSFLLPGKMKIFRQAETDEARKWIKAE